MDYRPFFISLEVAVWSTFVTFFLGLFLANFVYKLKRGKVVFDTIFTLPMILPPTVVGFFLLSVFGRNSPVGGFLHDIGITIVFTRLGAIIASIFVSFPLMYRTACGAFEQIDQNIINAAKTLGLSDTKIFWKIKIPMAKGGILAGTALSFSRALGEFGATIIIAGNIPGSTQSMSIAVFSAVSAGNRELAHMWVIILSLMSFIVILIINKYSRSR